MDIHTTVLRAAAAALVVVVCLFVPTTTKVNISIVDCLLCCSASVPYQKCNSSVGWNSFKENVAILSHTESLQ